MNNSNLIPISILFIILFQSLNAQEIQRFYYGNGGNAVHSSEITLSQTIGEPFSNVFNHYDAGLIKEIFLQQGFEQNFRDTTIFTYTQSNNTFSIKIYPNPTINEINMNFETALTQSMQLAIYDELGRFIKEEEKIKPTTTIDVQALIPGIYFIHLEDIPTSFRAIFPFVKL